MSAKKTKADQMTFDFVGSFNEANTPSEPEETWETEGEIIPGLSDPEEETEQAEEIMDTMTEILKPASETSAEVVNPSVKPMSAEKPLSKRDLKRVALAFLASAGASGFAMDVATRGNRYRADSAAFWVQPGTKKNTQIVSKTVLAEVRTTQEAKIECANHAEQLCMLRAFRMEREELENQIRQTEPELRDNSTLFTEFEMWNYSASKNPAYKECIQKLRKLEDTIYSSSKLNKFDQAQIASELYMIVPDQAIRKEDVPETWGLVYVHKDLSFSVEKKAVLKARPQDKLSRLAWNIAAAARDQILFANGIRANEDGTYAIGSLPRKRRHISL